MRRLRIKMGVVEYEEEAHVRAYKQSIGDNVEEITALVR
jgi:hypothetical protein